MPKDKLQFSWLDSLVTRSVNAGLFSSRGSSLQLHVVIVDLCLLCFLTSASIPPCTPVLLTALKLRFILQISVYITELLITYFFYACATDKCV